MDETKERVRVAITNAVNASGLTRTEFAERAGVGVTSVFAYMSYGAGFRMPPVEKLIRMALLSGNAAGFMLSLLPPDALHGPEWTQAEKLEAMDATEAMAQETARLIGESKRDDEAFGKLHARFAACYLMAYEARLQALAKGGE
jgi:hypothetical protein